MARQAYHVTAGAPDADHLKIDPNTWYSVGAVQSVYLKGTKNGALHVNTEQEKATAVVLKFPDDAALEDEGRTLYVFGEEGQKLVSDDGTQV